MNKDPRSRSAVAIYETHDSAEAAVRALQDAGIDMKHLSIIGKDFQTDEQAIGFYTTGDRMAFWGGRGALWGSLWGMLFGSALFFIPAVGPIVAMGPMVGWIVGALEGAAVGGAAGVLAAALASLGIPNDSVVKYELEVKAGKFLVLAHGDADLIEKARIALGTTDAAVLSGHGAELDVPPKVSKRADFVTREAIMNLLSDVEVAQVSAVESAEKLDEGDEYLDLEELARGVQRADGVPVAMGRILPRKALREHTWGEVLTQLEGRKLNASP